MSRIATLSAAFVLTSACAGLKDKGTQSPRPVFDAEQTSLVPPLAHERDVSFETDTAERSLPAAEAAPRTPPRSRPSERILARALQQVLDDAGHDPGPADGVMGPKTESAVRGFQVEAALAPTGMPDRETLEALFASSDPIEEVAGFEREPAEVRPAEHATGLPAWTVAILAIALLVALAANAAQYLASRRLPGRI